jgi:MFS family permease
MQEYLGLSSNQYYWAVVLFQLGYSLFGFLSNMVLARWRPSLYIPLMMFVWGTVAASLGAIRTTTQLLALRFLLGIVESGFSPAVTFLISSWYRKHEQSKRFIWWLSAAILAGAFGGIAAGAIADSIDGAHGIPGWRWLFIVEGVATCGASFVSPFFLLDYPLTTSRFTPAERELAYNRLLADGITSREEGGDNTWKTLLHSVTDWRVWLLGIAYMTIVGSLSLSYFYPTLVKGLGYTATTAQ